MESGHGRVKMFPGDISRGDERGVLGSDSPERGSRFVGRDVYCNRGILGAVSRHLPKSGVKSRR